jgi:GNAT superfamily N-acetyltransferase
MIIRFFESKDLVPFKKMCSAFYSTGATARGYDESLTIKTFYRILAKHENLWGVVFIDKESNEYVGYALMSAYWCNEDGGNVVILDELYIDTVNRHKGYGTQFMNWMEKEFKDKAVAFTLQVLKTNEIAQKLYKKIGFDAAGFEEMIKYIRKPEKN